MTRSQRVLIALSALALTIMTCSTAAFAAVGQPGQAVPAQQGQAVTSSHVLAEGGSTCCHGGN